MGDRLAPGRVTGLLIIAVLTAGLSSAAAAGHALSWFVIGPAGHRISMIGEDWAQDDWRLAQEAQRRGWKDIYFETYGRASGLELTRAGVSWTPLKCQDERPGWHIRHAARHLRRPDCERSPPDLVLDHHILVWDRRHMGSTSDPVPRPDP
jgi:hypothetical protein